MVVVKFRHPAGGRPREKVQSYYQDRKPDRTRVIRDLVPDGYLTTFVSIKQKR